MRILTDGSLYLGKLIVALFIRINLEWATLISALLSGQVKIMMVWELAKWLMLAFLILVLIIRIVDATVRGAVTTSRGSPRDIAYSGLTIVGTLLFYYLVISFVIYSLVALFSMIAFEMG